MSEARVRVSLVDGTMEIEGTESFVSGQLEKFGESIRVGFAQKVGIVEPPKVGVEEPPKPADDDRPSLEVGVHVQVVNAYLFQAGNVVLVDLIEGSVAFGGQCSVVAGPVRRTGIRRAHRGDGTDQDHYEP